MTQFDVRTLHLADVTFPQGHPRAGEAGPVNAFLVRSKATVLLIDTGLGPPHPKIDRWYRPVRRDLLDALGDAGIAPGDLTAIINSHLHFDHCGGNQLFPGVPIYVQAAEGEAAAEENYTVPEFVHFPGARYVFVDGEREVWPGVRLVPTPGHTPGHQSVVVDTGAGAVIIAAQAAETTADVSQAESLQPLLDPLPLAVLLSHDAVAWKP